MYVIRTPLGYFHGEAIEPSGLARRFGKPGKAWRFDSYSVAFDIGQSIARVLDMSPCSVHVEMIVPRVRDNAATEKRVLLTALRSQRREAQRARRLARAAWEGPPRAYHGSAEGRRACALYSEARRATDYAHEIAARLRLLDVCPRFNPDTTTGAEGAKATP